MKARFGSKISAGQLAQSEDELGSLFLKLSNPASAINFEPGHQNDNQISAPSSPYYGVVLRAIEREGARYFEIILGHWSRGSSSLVTSCPSDENIIADWRRLGAELQLPLYILNATGQLESVSFEAHEQRLRRFGSPLSGRRPRFLARRREGQPSLMAIIHPIVEIRPGV